MLALPRQTLRLVIGILTGHASVFSTTTFELNGSY